MATPRPPDFPYDEAQFISGFLHPLLRRLGYQVVADYHGQRELGKDLVFGEVDRFGHVRYHAMQAKCVKGIGQEESHTLVIDAEQAFNTPFRHPRTGNEERISTFYAVNGGTFADGARDYYFNSLRPRYGANVVLLDGKGLLALDRWAAANQIQSVVPRLNGLRSELVFNEVLADRLIPALAEYKSKIAGKGGSVLADPLPPNRFRENAIASFVEQPFVFEGVQLEMFNAYYEFVGLCNASLGKSVGLTTRQVVERNIQSFLESAAQMRGVSAVLLAQIQTALGTLGPLIGI